MYISRVLQNQILTELAGFYPESASPTCLESVEPKVKQANLFYLLEHQLIQAKILEGYSGAKEIINIRITHYGLDFLSDDGGLTAILGTVTVRFADSELKKLLETNLLKSNETPEEKKRLIKQLQELPSESIKHLTLKLLDLGLENSSSAIEIIKSFFQSLV